VGGKIYRSLSIPFGLGYIGESKKKKNSIGGGGTDGRFLKKRRENETAGVKE